MAIHLSASGSVSSPPFGVDRGPRGTPEEKYRRRMEKRQRKAERKAKEEALLGYTNESNPFNDSNLSGVSVGVSRSHNPGVVFDLAAAGPLELQNRAVFSNTYFPQCTEDISSIPPPPVLWSEHGVPSEVFASSLPPRGPRGSPRRDVHLEEEGVEAGGGGDPGPPVAEAPEGEARGTPRRDRRGAPPDPPPPGIAPPTRFSNPGLSAFGLPTSPPHPQAPRFLPPLPVLLKRQIEASDRLSRVAPPKRWSYQHNLLSIRTSPIRRSTGHLGSRRWCWGGGAREPVATGTPDPFLQVKARRTQREREREQMDVMRAEVQRQEEARNAVEFEKRGEAFDVRQIKMRRDVRSVSPPSPLPLPWPTHGHGGGGAGLFLTQLLSLWC